MDVAQWWIIDIILPAVLVIALVWLALGLRSNQTTSTTEAATREAQKGAETVASAAEEQSAAATEAQRAVQQQSAARRQ